MRGVYERSVCERSVYERSAAGWIQRLPTLFTSTAAARAMIEFSPCKPMKLFARLSETIPWLEGFSRFARSYSIFSLCDGSIPLV
jgi:hypothetical protein